jgi:quinol monooxygenase YgiN
VADAQESTTADDDPVVLVAMFQARTGAVDELRHRLIAMVEHSRAEQGCLRYDLHEFRDDPCRFAFVETWASPAALDQHDATEHVRAILADAPRLTAGPLVIHRLRPVTSARPPGA